MLASLQTTLTQKGYKIFTRPFELNIVGIRADSTKPNSFDDSLNIFYKTLDGKWKFQQFPATTDPGTYWLANPMSSKGTAILKHGQNQLTQDWLAPWEIFGIDTTKTNHCIERL